MVVILKTMLGDLEVLFAEPILWESVMVYGVEGSILSLVILTARL